jgi:glycine/D-amino acid oxidase-like deaminating enzyme
MVVEDEASLPAARAKCAWLAEQGVPFEWLDSAGLHECEPGLAPGLEHAAWFPMDAQIEPRVATAALVAAARARGTVVLLHEAVTSIEVRDGGRSAVVTTSVRAIETPHLVVAAGVWTAGLLKGIADLPVAARKGQIAVVTAPIRVRHKMMEAGYAGTVASGDAGLQVAAVVESTRSGSILLGSSRQITHPDDRAVDVAVLNRIIARAIEFFPGLAAARLFRSYAGLRPMSPDHVPIVGPLPGHPAVMVATGHEGGGVMGAAATGELIARRIAGEPMPVPDDVYLPDRLGAGVSRP